MQGGDDSGSDEDPAALAAARQREAVARLSEPRSAARAPPAPVNADPEVTGANLDPGGAAKEVDLF